MRLLLSVVLLTAFIGCGGKKLITTPSPEQRLQEIKKLYEKKKYDRVIEEVEVYMIAFSGTAKIDSAQLLLAEAHFALKEYLLAQAEYKRLADQFPSSPLVEEARYKSANCWWELSPKHQLDQAYTKRALDEFQLVLEEFPRTSYAAKCEEMIGKCREKLALKELDAAQLYQKMGKFDAAVRYYDQVMEHYYATKSEPKAYLGKAQSLVQLDDQPAAIAAYKRLLEKFPGSPEAVIAGQELRSLPVK